MDVGNIEKVRMAGLRVGLHMGGKGESVSAVQFSSVAQLWPTLCNPMNRSMPGLSVHHQLLEFT